MDRQAITRSYIERMLSGESEEPKALPLSVLEDMTNNFADDHEIGRGGFAVVYKGKLGHMTIAVKRLSRSHLQEKEFHREVQCLMKIKHKNIVRFLGYCADTQGSAEIFDGNFVMADVQQRLLCFEYLPNGSLYDHITDASRGLEWRMRYEIIKGITEGLHYLHQNHIVHLDLKPANVLLNENLVPKIADFGLSRCFGKNQLQATITALVGSLGYLAPEFFGGKITMKSDMYSLGVIITEMLTGEKGYTNVENVLENWRNRLDGSECQKQLEQIRVCAEIAVECIEFNPAKRPDPHNVIDRLGEVEITNGSIVTVVTSTSAAQVLESLNKTGLDNSRKDKQLEQVQVYTEAGEEPIDYNPEQTPDVGHTTDRLDEMEIIEQSTETDGSSSRTMQRLFMASESAEPVDLRLSLLEDITKVEAVRASENEAIQKMEADQKKMEDIELAIESALKRAEMAEAAKRAVESELRRWREKEHKKAAESVPSAEAHATVPPSVPKASSGKATEKNDGHQRSSRTLLKNFMLPNITGMFHKKKSHVDGSSPS